MLGGAVLGRRRAAAHDSSIRVALCVPYDFPERMPQPPPHARRIGDSWARQGTPIGAAP